MLYSVDNKYFAEIAPKFNLKELILKLPRASHQTPHFNKIYEITICIPKLPRYARAPTFIFCPGPHEFPQWAQWQIQGVAMVSAETPSERAHPLINNDWLCKD